MYACLPSAPDDIPSALPDILPYFLSEDDEIFEDESKRNINQVESFFRSIQCFTDWLFVYLHFSVSAIFEDLADMQDMQASSARIKGKRKLGNFIL